jgi:hypothetical protein
LVTRNREQRASSINFLKENGDMKNFIFILLIATLFCTVLPANSGELDKPYSPTRKEWLEISIYKTIKGRTDPWKQRISSLVWVIEADNTIYITLTSANGQDEIEKKTQNEYVDTIKKDIETLIKEYEWASKLKVYVQYV